MELYIIPNNLQTEEKSLFQHLAFRLFWLIVFIFDSILRICMKIGKYLDQNLVDAPRTSKIFSIEDTAKFCQKMFWRSGQRHQKDKPWTVKLIGFDLRTEPGRTDGQLSDLD